MNPAPAGRKFEGFRYRAFLLVSVVWLLGTMPAAAAEPGARAFDLAVKARKLAHGPSTLRLVRGDKATLRWTVDEPMTIHVHGYDVSLDVRPGTSARMSIEARHAGRFPVTAHLHGVAREPTLLYLEVHPE